MAGGGVVKRRFIDLAIGIALFLAVVAIVLFSSQTSEKFIYGAF
jgi:hypothetical protein